MTFTLEVASGSVSTSVYVLFSPSTGIEGEETTLNGRTWNIGREEVDFTGIVFPKVTFSRGLVYATLSSKDGTKDSGRTARSCEKHYIVGEMAYHLVL